MTSEVARGERIGAPDVEALVRARVRYLRVIRTVLPREGRGGERQRRDVRERVAVSRADGIVLSVAMAVG